MRLALVLAVTSLSLAGQSITFYRDVLPILQNNCQTCHRPGEIGPMPLLSYEGARPWAKSIKTAVLSKKMPPWFADPQYGHFSNDNRLKETEIQKLVAWVDAGAPAGDPKDAPPPVKWVEGWNIGQPDVVIEMPTEYSVPATGTIDYTYVIVPSGFTKDTWVQAAEVRPGNRAHVHHANVSVRPPDSKYFREYPIGVPFVPNKGASSGTSEYIVGYTPGKPAINLASNEARLIPAGSDFIFQLHYTSNGTPVKDKTKLGVIFAKNPPERRVSRVVAANQTFAIPPGNPDYHVDGAITLNQDAEIVSLKPHMHLRGKWMEFRAIYPTGEKQVLLSVPHYDFNWQLDFVPVQPIKVPKGTRLEVYAGFDNSPNNPFNPDPTKTIRWGDQSWDEMMGGFFEISYDPKLDPSDILVKTKRTIAAAAIAPE